MIPASAIANEDWGAVMVADVFAMMPFVLRPGPKMAKKNMSRRVKTERRVLLLVALRPFIPLYNRRSSLS
jgi:hypothetical protein